VPFDIIETVIECANEVVSWEDVNGWLPLHYACAKGASIDVIKALLQIYPEGSRIRDQRLRTPLHFVFYKGSLDGGDTNAGGTEKNSEVFFDSQGSNETDYEREAVVSSRDAVKIADEKNRLPLHLAAAYGCSSAALEILVHSFPDSIYCKEESGCTPFHYVMSNAHNKSSPSTLGFLLNEMDEASITASDDNGQSPLQLICIRPASADEECFRSVAICFAGAIYFISREVSQIISTISLGTFRAWILNADNWLDVGVVSLLFYYCLNMKGR
jgi:ankyrin repeat protein